MVQELVFPIGTGLTQIIVPKTLEGKVVKVLLKEVIISGVDAGQVGNCWILRLGSDWVMEEFNTIKTVTNAGTLDNGTQWRSGARDIGLFIGDSPVFFHEFNNPPILVDNKPLKQQIQLTDPYFVLASDGQTKPVFTSAWVKLQLWTEKDPILTSNTQFLQRQWRN